MSNKSENLSFNPIKYRTSSDLEFWFDYSKRSVVTSDPDISLSCVQGGERNSEMVFFLRIGGLSIRVGYAYGFGFPPEVWGSPESKTLWRIGSIGDPLYYSKKLNKYVSRPLLGNGGQDLPIATDTKFASREQQNQAIIFISEALEKYNGNWLGAARGQEQKSSVEFSEAIARKLESGEFLA